MQFKLVICLLVLALSYSLAEAEISDQAINRYNKAAQSGDTASLLAAATRLADEAVESPGHEDATLLAYEAAWALCRNGQCERALPAAEFAARQPDTGDHPSMADRNLLAAYANWVVSPGKATRVQLDDALGPRVGDAPTLLSVTAFHARYLKDVTDADYDRAEITAGQASQHFHPAREQIARLWSDAQLAEHTSAFNDRHEPQAIVGMARLNGALSLMRHVTVDDPEWLDKHYYTTEAWLTAMDAYFDSRGRAKKERDLAEQIQEDAVTDDNHTHPEDASIHDDEREQCPGNFTRPPKPSYPDKAARDGYVGAVIVLFDVDEGGATDFRIGASVPTSLFDEEVIRALEKLTWKWEEPKPGAPPCRRSVENAVYPFQFIIGG